MKTPRGGIRCVLWRRETDLNGLPATGLYGCDTLEKADSKKKKLGVTRSQERKGAREIFQGRVKTPYSTPSGLYVCPNS